MSKVHILLYLLLLMVVNMYKHMGKVVIKILQGGAVTLTMLGGLTIHHPVTNFLQCICATNYENCLAVDKVIAKIIRLTFLAHPVNLSSLKFFLWAPEFLFILASGAF